MSCVDDFPTTRRPKGVIGAKLKLTMARVECDHAIRTSVVNNVDLRVPRDR